jgi:holo-[acyl-carrier protein] synthase
MGKKSMQGIGIDVVEIPRMRRILKEKRGRFLANTFSPVEQKYCKSYKNSAVHFAGTFAAKEAVRKAASLYIPFNELEIRRAKDKKPQMWIRGKKSKNILISITYTKTLAYAVAISK